MWSRLVRRVSLFAGFLLFLGLSAFAGSGQPTPDPTEVVKTLAGEYTFLLTAEDLAASGMDDPDLEESLGTWLFNLTEDGKFSASLNGRTLVDGKYGAKGLELEIYLESVCSECACSKNIGRYNWTLEGNELRLKEAYDLCDQLVFVVTTKPLVRK